MATAWPKQTHDDYQGQRWEEVRSHLEGTVVDNLDDYLIRKRQGEADAAYRTRKDIASYVPHYSRAILSLAGMIMQKEDEADRSWWGEDTALGAPQQDGSIMTRLWRNADGAGTDWPVHITQVLNRLNGYQRIWGIVEGVEREAAEEGPPTMADAQSDGRVRLINPIAVRDWDRDASGRLTEVQVEYEKDKRGGVKEAHDKVTRWNVYTLEGVEVWEEDNDAEDGARRIETRPYGPNGFQYRGRDDRAALPIWQTEVPVPMPVGYLMAKFASWLFNFRNGRNFHLWSSCLARWWVDAVDDNGAFDQQLWDKFEELAKKGSAGFPKEIGYAAPPMDGAEVRNDTLADERDAFYVTFFQSYGDAAREATATEIRHDVAQGVAAYLSLVTRALDEYENDALWRLAQVHEPGQPEVWGQASVSRTDDFSPENIRERINQLRTSVFGERSTVPAGETTKVEAAKSIWDMLNVPYEEEEVTNAVRRQDRREAQRQALEEEFGTDLGQ